MENAPNVAQETSLGRDRVGVGFNPSEDSDIGAIKMMSANLIDHINNLKKRTNNPEAQRCFKEAMLNIETASMYGVKGITKDFK